MRVLDRALKAQGLGLSISGSGRIIKKIIGSHTEISADLLENSMTEALLKPHIYI